MAAGGRRRRTAVLAELPHVIAVGTRVIGYLPRYFKEEHYGSGSRFLLLGLTGLGARGQIALGAAILAAVTVAVWRRGSEPARAVTAVLGALLLIVTPVQPWYAVTLAGLGCLADVPWWTLVAVAGEPYYATVILDDPHQVLVGRLAYGLAALGIVALAGWRRHLSTPAQATR